MSRRLCLFAIHLSCVFCSASVVNAATRVALISTCGGDAAGDVLALAEAKLSAERDVVLVERQSVERILDEQKLQTCGLSQAEQALVAGRLLGVQVFAALETFPDSKEVLGMVAFDASTGVRLWDAVLPAGGPDKTADGVVAAVRSACEKRQRTRADLHTVCLLSVRNAELPRGMDSFCEAVGDLLERQLVCSPTLTLLERKRLEQVNRERSLPVDKPAGDLFPSLVMMEMDIGRAEARNGIKATAFLSDSAGREMARFTCSSKREDAAELTRLLLTEVIKNLKALPVDRAVDPTQEAERFFREGKFLAEHAELARGLRAIESAHALDPNNPSIQSLLARYLVTSAHDGLDNTPAGLNRSLAVAGRAVDIATCSSRESRLDDDRDQLSFLLEESYLSGPLANYLHELFKAYPIRDIESERAIRGLQKQYRDYVVDYLHTKAYPLVRDASSFNAYTGWLGESVLKHSELWSPSGRVWVTDTATLLSEWMKLAQSYPLQWDIGVSVNRMLARLACRVHGLGAWKLENEDSRRLSELFQTMERHRDPVIQLYGASGQLWRDMHTGAVATAGAVERVQTIRGCAQKTLAGLKTEPAKNYRVLLYDVANDAIKILPAPELRQREYAELLHFMLDQHEIAYGVLMQALEPHGNIYRFYNFMGERFPDDEFNGVDPERYPDTLRDIDRVQAALREPDCHVLNASESGVRGTIAEFRQEIAADRPDLAPPTRAAWQSARALLDVSQNKNVGSSVGAVIEGNTVYALATYQTDKQLIRVSLLGDSVTLLGKLERAQLSWHLPQSACVCEKAYYFATQSAGILAFPLDGSPPTTISQATGLPSDDVYALGCEQGKLYAGLGGGFIVSYDPQSKRCEVIVSSKRKDKRNPLDDVSPPFRVHHLIGDPQRHRVLFTIEGSDANDSIGGLWELDAETKRVRQLLELYHYVDWVSPIRDGHIYLHCVRWAMGTYNAVIGLDLATDRADVLYASNDSDAGPNLRASPKTIRIHNRLFPPFLIVDGWLWSAAEFGRISPDGKTQELFPPLSAAGYPSYLRWQSLELVSDRSQVLVVDGQNLWLLDLPNRHSKD